MIAVLAEKPSVARELASFFGATERHDGYYEGQGYQVTWALGHLVTLKEPHDYDPTLKKWSLETLPFVPERFGLKPLHEKGAGKQLAVVRRLFRAADELIAATDAGREGELIFRYILELTGCGGKPARRLWLNSLTREAIRQAFSHLRPLSRYDALYAAARCRDEADWIVGLNATRYYTVRYGTGGLLWSVGRVQTPVLAMIVRRDDEIRTFKPEPFWELLTRYRGAVFKFAGDRFVREDDAQSVLRRVQGQPFVILGVERKPERIQPPQLYDLTELQRDMNRRFGLSADATLKAAQSLYEDKLITYPRTDSRYLGGDMRSKIPGILEDLRSIRPDEIGKLDLGALAFTGRIINDAKVGDHHAIIPTGKQPGALSPVGQKVYDAVVTRLIAAFYPAGVKEVTTVAGISNGVPFRARGVRVLEPGWTVLYPRKHDEKEEDEQELPEFRSGESGPHEPSIREGETAPPKPYTDASLLGAMETAGKLVDDEQLKEALKEKGLGTPATRAAIIETLLERGYISREKKALRGDGPGPLPRCLGPGPRFEEPGADRRLGSEAPRDRARPPGLTSVHDGDRRVHRRGDPSRRRDIGRRESARRLPALWPSGDRREARFRLLWVAGGLSVRLLARIQGPLVWGRPDPTALAAASPARATHVLGVRRGRHPVAREWRVGGDPGPSRRTAASYQQDGAPARWRANTKRTARARHRRARSGSPPRPAIGVRSGQVRPMSALRLGGCGAGEVLWLQRLAARVQVRDLEDDRRQANHTAHRPGTPQAGTNSRAQGLRVEVRQAIRGAFDTRGR